jgi:hypothetical protein
MLGVVGLQRGDPDRPHGLHGLLRNLPTRAVRGSRWSGEETSWRHMPRHYAAIHFHEDDLYDCGWENGFHRRNSCRNDVRGLWHPPALR